jgi:hypothetical protein
MSIIMLWARMLTGRGIRLFTIRERSFGFVLVNWRNYVVTGIAGWIWLGAGRCGSWETELGKGVEGWLLEV